MKKKTKTASRARGKKLPVIHRPAANLRYANRTLCSAIYDMREVLNALEKAVEDDKHLKKLVWILRTLVEEFQVYGNRMEAGLDDQRSIEELKEEFEDLEKRVKEHKKTLGIAEDARRGRY